MRDPDDYVGVDFPPAVIGNVVALELCFDRNIPEGDTIAVSPQPVWDIWVISGADPTPAARLLGSATIDAATTTKTQQRVDLTGLTVGAYYGLRARVTSVSGQALSLSSRMRVNARTP